MSLFFGHHKAEVRVGSRVHIHAAQQLSEGAATVILPVYVITVANITDFEPHNHTQYQKV